MITLLIGTNDHRPYIPSFFIYSLFRRFQTANQSSCPATRNCLLCSWWPAVGARSYRGEQSTDTEKTLQQVRRSHKSCPMLSYSGKIAVLLAQMKCVGTACSSRIWKQINYGLQDWCWGDPAARLCFASHRDKIRRQLIRGGSRVPAASSAGHVMLPSSDYYLSL